MKVRELLSPAMMQADVGEIFIKALMLKLGARPQAPVKKIAKVKHPAFTPPPPPLPSPPEAQPLDGI